MVCLERYMFTININICGLFTVDLKSLFTLVAEIIKFSLILFQIDYFLVYEF